MTGGHTGHAATLRDYVHVVQRRKWIILTSVVLVPLAAVAFSLYQQKLYQGTSEVLLNRQNLANALTGAQDPSVYQQDTTITQTQAYVARVPAVAALALKFAGVTSLTAQDLLSASTVTVKSNADLLDFAVTNHDSLVARRLANGYARAYTVYRRQLDTASVKRALASVDNRLRQLAKADDRKSALYTNLLEREQQLAEMAALQSSQAYVVQQADDAAQVQPKPIRNGILGLALGLILGVGLAYAYVAYRIGDGADAEDVTSDTFERALRYRSSYDPQRGDPAAWLIGIARRCIADAALKRVTPTNEVRELVGDGHEETALTRIELRTAVARLDERDRELVALRFGADLSARQIGELLDMKTNAVEVALHRALARLRGTLEGEDALGGDSQTLRPEVSP